MALFEKEVQWIGGRYARVDGVMDPLPMRGIAKAHLNCIKTARDSGWEMVLIMEDDVVFQGKERTLPYLNEALKHVPEDWDVIVGGVYECKRMTKVNEYWSKIGEFCSLHFYIARGRAYDVILEWNEKHHIDRWVNQGGKKLNCYCPNKFIATQRRGFSDNVKKIVDYTDRLKRFELL